MSLPRVHRLKFETNAGAKVRFGRDVFDNCVAACSFSGPATELRFQLELDLALEKKNPFDFLLKNEVASCLFPIPPIYAECSRLSGKRRRGHAWKFRAGSSLGAARSDRP